jgi:hypothetical protein
MSMLQALERIITTLADDIAGVTVMALYMVLERFRNADAAPVYRRFRERGRMAPDGLNYISSWVTEDMSTCFQVMETENRALLEDWMSHWSDLVDFEVHPVVSSKEAAQRAGT